MKIITASHPRALDTILRELRVDPYGIKIMLPKGIPFLVMVEGISCIAANILKQEMLSVGGDVALPRDTLTSRSKKTGCLIIGNLSQLRNVIEKLRIQPFGLNAVAKELVVLLHNYQKNDFHVVAKKDLISLRGRAHLMGILNSTPDSFSGDGMYGQSLQCIQSRIEKIIDEGADSIDIGGVSSRPGAKPVTLKEELRRTIPIVKIAAKRTNVPLSIDTTRAEVARQALDNGASIVNDITALGSKDMTKVVARSKAAVILMHMRGTPRTMQKNPSYNNVLDEIRTYLRHAIDRALEAGIDARPIIVDPGIGFGKALSHNEEILAKLTELKALGMPLLVGPSRKSFIGTLTRTTPSERLAGTIASCVVAYYNGAHMLRVHDVLQVKQALEVAGAILNRC